MSYDRERKGERQIGVLGRKEKWIELVEEKGSEKKSVKKSNEDRLTERANRIEREEEEEGKNVKEKVITESIVPIQLNNNKISPFILKLYNISLQTKALHPVHEKIK